MSKETGLILLLCASIAGVSFWLGRSYPAKETVTVQTVSNEAYKTTLQTLEQKMRQITETDLAEYRRLKDRKAQYEKAEEILAKILQIFVADLGLRIGKTDLDKLANHDPAPLPPEPAHAPAPAPVKRKPEPPAPPAPQGESLNWKVMEARLPEVRNEEDADKFLKSVSVDNLFPAIRVAKPAQRRLLEELMGRYFGQIRFADTSVKAKDMELVLEVKAGGDKPDGSYKIIISQDGNPESNTSGSGGFPDYYNTDGSASILVRATPNNYAQLYWSSPLNQLFGNYYKMDAPDRYSPIGTVFLRRR